MLSVPFSWAQYLNAGLLQPPHGWNPDDEKSERGSDVGQQHALVRQLGPLPSQSVSNERVRLFRHGKSLKPCRKNAPAKGKAQQF